MLLFILSGFTVYFFVLFFYWKNKFGVKLHQAKVSCILFKPYLLQRGTILAIWIN